MLIIKNRGKYRVVDFIESHAHVINGVTKTIEIRSVSFSEIEPYKAQAEREHLLFAESTNYFLAKADGVPMGFFGLLLYSEKAVSKNVFVFPEYRGNKLWGLFFNVAMSVIKRTGGIKELHASATPVALPLYINEGAVEVYRYKTHKLVQVKMKL